jgi:hypothetical protein
MRCVNNFLIYFYSLIYRLVASILLPLLDCTKFMMKFKTTGGVCNIQFH